MMPEPIWEGVDRIGIRCLFDTPTAVDRGAMRQRLCDHVSIEVRQRLGSRFDVAHLDVVDERLVDPRTLLVLIQGRVEPASHLLPGVSGYVVTTSVRLARHDPSLPPPALFGAAPRAVLLADEAQLTTIGAAGNAVTDCVDGQVAEIIPGMRSIPRGTTHDTHGPQ